MLTLTRTVVQTKLTLKWLGISITVLFLISVLTKNGATIKEHLFPVTPPPTTVTFGKLPPIYFPISAMDKTILSYSLDTITGLLPTFPDQAKVYKMLTVKPEFLALDKARQKVYRVGLGSTETRLAENLYRWTDEVYLSREITLNLFSHDFTLSSSFLSSPAVINSIGNFSNENSAISTSREFLHGMSFFPDDIDIARTKTLFYSIKTGRLTPITNVSSAQVVRVDFFQKNVDTLPIYYPNASTSTVNLLILGPRGPLNQETVVEANFHYQPISYQFATYPIKTTSQAYDELKSQKAYIASYYGGGSSILIKNIFLGYYIGATKQNYLMPIVIFEGEGGFFAYVSAVRDEWIGN